MFACDICKIAEDGLDEAENEDSLKFRVLAEANYEGLVKSFALDEPSHHGGGGRTLVSLMKLIRAC